MKAKAELPILGTHEFATYLAAYWKLSQNVSIPTDAPHHESLARAFQGRLADLRKEFNIKFLIFPNPLHGTSEVVADMMYIIVCCYLGRFEGKHLLLTLSKEDADRIIQPLSARAAELVSSIARETIAGYRPEPPMAISTIPTA